MKTVSPNIDHQAFRLDFIDLLKKHTGDLDSSEMVAVAAYVLGQMMAMMDARVWSPPKVLEMIGKNIELGNAYAISEADKWMPRA